jgi:competence protein ComEC
MAVTAAIWVTAAVLPPAHVETPPGPVTLEGVLTTGVVDGRYGPWALLETPDGRHLLDLEDEQVAHHGTAVRVEGVSDGTPGSLGTDPYNSTVVVQELLPAPNQPDLIVVGEAVRDHVLASLEPLDGGRALLAGFLIGDTTGLDDADLEAMRLSGLSHFVAVSGSNIALFLGLLSIVAGPLALGPKRRAVVCLIGLPVYAAATRFEPSVLRASMMAGIVLVGRLVGVALESWQLVALAVGFLLLAEPGLANSVGFQLSVAATIGVLVGSRWPITGGRSGRALAVAMGAQLAVAPLLLLHFGAVPLLSPVANLLAAPLVATSTILGAIGALGFGLITDVGSVIATLVLEIANGASMWPQVGTAGFLLALVLVGAALRWRWARAPIAVAVAALAVVLLLGTQIPDAAVVVLDIGQGDAILVDGGDGHVALVDGGPEAAALLAKLRGYGISAIELVVITHPHADHLDGLVGLAARYPVGEVWAAIGPHATATSDQVVGDLRSRRVPVIEAVPGMTRQLGALTLRVLGPLRRYESPNDQSIVLEIEGSARSMLLTGDIETLAQSELGRLEADVLKVPHHGGGTSDRAWLAGVGADVAVIPVGDNDFGHPVPWVIETLQASGAVVMRTDREGDVLVELSE